MATSRRSLWQRAQKYPTVVRMANELIKAHLSDIEEGMAVAMDHSATRYNARGVVDALSLYPEVLERIAICGNEHAADRAVQVLWDRTRLARVARRSKYKEIRKFALAKHEDHLWTISRSRM